MGLDIAALRKMVRKPIGIEDDDTDLLDDEIDLYLNRSFWEIQDKFPFREKERTVTFETVIGTRNYDMPKPFDALLSLSIEAPTSQRHAKLERIEPDVYEGWYINKENERGAPTHYTREDCFARLWPTPDAEYTMVLKRLITLTDISASNTTPGIPRVWHEIIGMGGSWRAFIDFGDIARANAIKQHQIALINTTVPTQAKEERDSREAGLEVLRREY